MASITLRTMNVRPPAIVASRLETFETMFPTIQQPHQTRSNPSSFAAKVSRRRWLSFQISRIA
jgi:hypothetical protein